MRLADLIEQAQAGERYWAACTVDRVTIADGWLRVSDRVNAFGDTVKRVSLKRGSTLRLVRPADITAVKVGERWEPVE